MEEMPAAPIQLTPHRQRPCPTYREELQTVQLSVVLSSRRLLSLLAACCCHAAARPPLGGAATGDEGSPECGLWKGPCTGPVEAAVGLEGLWDDRVGGWFESNESLGPSFV